MKVIVYDSPDEKFESIVKEWINFCLEELVKNKKILNYCQVELAFHDSLPNDDFGEVQIVERNSRKKARKFRLCINSKIGSFSILETICHECVHIKQYIYDEIDEYLDHWKGVSIDHKTVDYWYHPWEIEAHGLEKGLMQKIISKYKLWEILEGFTNPKDPVEEKIIWKK